MLNPVRWSRASRAVVTAIAVAVAVGLPVARPAYARPAPGVQEVRRQLAVLHEQTETYTERYNKAREDLSSVHVRLEAARTQLAERQAALVGARRELGQVAADTYKAGDLASLSLFLSDDPDAYVQADGLLVSLADRRAAAVSDLQVKRQLVMASATDLEEQQQRLQRTQAELTQAQKDVERKIDEADRLLGRLTGDEREAVAAGDEASDRAGLAEEGVDLPIGRRPSCTDVPIGPFTARVSKVVAYACAQLNKPYRWGAAGPDRFDCSGLTMMAWKQAGVSLPHNAAMQAGYGTTVGMDELQPGDLVFFFSPIGHNGIYIGHGLMIHAPRTGDRVKIAPVRGIGPFTTAVRL